MRTHRPNRGFARAAACLLAALASLALSPAGARASGGEQQLAQRYAPILELRRQSEPCDSSGEAYRPVPVDVIFGRPDVRLLDASGRLLAQSPTAATLFGQGPDTYIDLPGSPLEAGCSYERWANSVSAGAPTTTYAHVVSEQGHPGVLALQYWFYYLFNDWNNKHESDWEMIQLMFDADSASQALQRSPTEVGYAQHSGAERAAWGEPKLQLDGTHPIVYPGAGSHASYYTGALWLGYSAAEGFGCDNTTGPWNRLATTPVLLPSAAPESRADPFAWLAFQGHWGQKTSSSQYTGPTGPNMKEQWSRPVTWSEQQWRSSSTQVPLRGQLGTSTTAFFCGAVARGSTLFIDFLRAPWKVLTLLAAVMLAALLLRRRTRWQPAAPVPVDRVRAAGEQLVAAGRLYRREPLLFLRIGIVCVPLAVPAVLAQHALLGFTGLGTIVQQASGDSLVAGIVALLFGQLSTLASSVLVTAACAEALTGIDEGAPRGALELYRAIAARLGALAWAWLRVVVVAGLLSLTVVGIPFAVVYLVRKAVVTQSCVIEHAGATRSLRRSSALVGRHLPRVLAITAAVNVTAYLSGPLAGLLVLFTTHTPLALVNLVSSAVYVIALPYAGIAIALLFYDLRGRERRRVRAAAAQPA